MIRIGLAILIFLFSSTVYSLERAGDVKLQTIKVKSGDTLHGIADKYLKDPSRWPEIYRYNNNVIDDPDYILPAMELKLPVELIKEHLRAAHLIYLLREVRARRRGESEWQSAKLNMKLSNGDAIRTLRRSFASIGFESGEVLKIRENSLVVLRSEKEREEVELLSGELRAAQANVLTAAALIEPRLSLEGPKPDFKARVRKDKSTQVAVYTGKVDVASDGVKITLSEGFRLNIDYGKGIEEPQPFVYVPASAEGKAFAIEYYHLEIAQDENFRELVVDKESVLDNSEYFWKLFHSTGKSVHSSVENFMANTFPMEFFGSSEEKSRLPDGRYFWRLFYCNDLGAKIKASSVKSLVIDTKPPKLEIFLPRKRAKTKEEFVVVKGKTEEGSTVEVNGERAVTYSEGNFVIYCKLVPGKNILTILARDRAGNVSAAKREVVRK
ncbi:LysM peptidoglycan-binding domain-containing protein [bacterium]|nr:LysM peptidoglycan-binding domain-containing protein [bacterium]NIN92364.1 LysM peptidoglycan-binding domain-containing protein [bacterium]NIO18478.1 LysM peptidoglycan-binding domain-containing protein [bacterium]NIO73474.1 LysM peptidoglycan-binding domain-containing protein [bacterium]